MLRKLLLPISSARLLAFNRYSLHSNLISVRQLATKKRFYRNTGVLFNDGKFEVTLDQRKLKTPKGNPFQVDNEMLALAVSAEWNAQKEIIQQSSMHLTGLCSTVLDNPSNLSKYDIVQELMGYIDTDTILFTSAVS